ncbi:glycoside hydrolase family 55 protein [Hebeloma cylindrosporum]|uniref:Glycoside hydrolase family 55 protein n=1 Tax=Hebeloma cylindrosporum TaxID=76867 RepID=A0A0C3C2M6_HEBCY|nr:glycoside hydrolase family 55 protein [Hebeloma cylindrosporum h7]
MSRAITRVLLSTSLTLALFLHHSVLVHAIPTDTTAAMASKSGSILKSALNAISQRGSTTDNLNSNACSYPSRPVPGSVNGSASPFWMEKIKHQGKAPFNSDPEGYKVFRNVKDYGAVGDGVHDDTAAINLAITSQNRCGGGTCHSSTVSPAIVYFPQGTYLISAPIIPYYYTQLIGDAKVPPTLLAAPSFDGFAVIDANPYIPAGGGAQYFQATNNFHRSIRNFVIDVRQVPPEKQQGTGIHWQVAQATSLINIVFEMSAAPNTAHQGIWMENGSGGFMGDLVFNGGKFGIWGGNQQFTVRNITVNNAQTGVYSLWNWGWTYQDVKFNNCQIGFDISTGGLTVETQTTGAQTIIDATVTNTPIFIQTSQPSNGSLAGSLVINNAKLTNVPAAVRVASNGAIVLAGTSPLVRTKTIASWVQGNVYKGNSGQAHFTQGNVEAPTKPSMLLDSQGKVVGKAHPQYADHDVEDFVSVRDFGAVGDGVTDDTKALQAVFDKFSSCKIIFLDAGFYVVSSTLTIPAGTRLVGEAWSVIAGKGPAFQNQLKPQVVVRVGERWGQSQQVTEITDVVFTTVGPAAGAIVVEWNVRQPDGVQAGAGMWDTHIRLAGSKGTNLEASTCPQFATGSYDPCYAAFMSLHITPSATGYFEGTWVWLADHDLDLEGEGMITVYAGRGILSESQGPVWMIGTASEHHVIYQYNLVRAKNHYMGLIQTESPYFQPKPAVPTPFRIDPAYHDPKPFEGSASSWALAVKDSQDILIFGAGLYSFFVNYSQDCVKTRDCQTQIATISSSSSNVNVYGLSTVASVYQLSVDGVGVIDQKDNVDGFASTVTVWRSAR